jgi:hypothetical protein
MDPREELRNHLRPAVLVAAALGLSMAVYFVLVEVLRRTRPPFLGFLGPGVDAQPFRYAAYGLAAVIVLVILVLRPRLFRRRDVDDLPAALRRIQSASLIMLVLGEVPSVAGLALFLVVGQVLDFYKLLFVSLFLTFLNFPRAGAWEEWSRS